MISFVTGILVVLNHKPKPRKDSSRKYKIVDYTLIALTSLWMIFVIGDLIMVLVVLLLFYQSITATFITIGLIVGSLSISIISTRVVINLISKLNGKIKHKE